jgi:hypothetical protein
MSATQDSTPPERPADAYGKPMSEVRQAELQGYLDRWGAEIDHGERIGPCVGMKLSGADVSWLADHSG